MFGFFFNQSNTAINRMDGIRRRNNINSQNNPNLLADFFMRQLFF